MKLINLTPHKIVIRTNDKTLAIEPEKAPARVKMITQDIGVVNGINVVKNTVSEIENLPEPVEGIGYLVSIVVLGATNRKDLFAPDTGPTAYRDEKGFIQCVTRLVNNYTKE